MSIARALVPAVLAAAFCSGLLADDPAPVIYVESAKAAEMISKTGLMTRNAEFMVTGAHRGAAGQVEVHERTTDILYIVEGEVTYVTGGKVINGKQTTPGEWLGESIEGGEEHHLKKGDVIIVPAGQPHWFKAVSPQLNSFMVRVNKPPAAASTQPAAATAK